MAPSWSSRLLAGSKRTNSNDNASRNTASRDTALPDIPSQIATPSSNNNDLTNPRPHTAGGPPMHHHSRSASQPIPKLFARKKSAGNLRQDSAQIYDDFQASPHDGSPLEPLPLGADRIVGKRKGSDNPDSRIQRRCICCDSKVKVPKELDKFRCMSCLTINDLKPLVRQEGTAPEQGRQASPSAASPPGPPALTIERTRAVLERCLIMYLESRSRKVQGHEPSSVFAARAVATTSKGDTGRPQDLAAQLPDRRVLGNAPLHASPPVTPSETPAEFPEGLSSQSPAAGMSKSITGSPSISRKPVPGQPSRRPPPPPAKLELRQKGSSQNLRPELRAAPSHERPPGMPTSPRLTAEEAAQRHRYERIKTIFKPLDDYIVATFGNMAVLNASFSTLRPVPVGRARSESHITTPPAELLQQDPLTYSVGLDELDAKMLLLGDIGENGSWWTGKSGRNTTNAIPRKKVGSDSRKPVTSKSPNINWSQVAVWYDTVYTAGMDWQRQFQHLREASLRPISNLESDREIGEVEQDLREAREHTVRTLLKVIENTLKRPGRPLDKPELLRFLFIILANPSFYPTSKIPSFNMPQRQDTEHSTSPQTTSPKKPRKESLHHTGLLKRIFGLLANTPDTCHRYIVGWLSKLSEEHFISLTDLCMAFINYRLSRRPSRPSNHFTDGGLIPDLSGGALSTSAQLHSAMGLSGSAKSRSDDTNTEPEWASDWQTKCAAKFMSLLFAANNIWQGKRKEDSIPRKDSGTSNRMRLRDKAQGSEQLLPISAFYNTLLDYHELIADYKVWESKKDKFAFCQYPLFLSMGAKIKILNYDAKRQMEIKAREAIFDQVIRQRAIDGHLVLRVRRDCLVEDSLRQISEAVGADQEELKKGLRIQFANEEGVDAGGLRKEWFLIVAREVFDAEHGLFTYDEQSRTCYFNPHTFETSDQFYLVGALLGLAIYNSIILDIALPSFAFRKLMAAAPASSTQSAGHTASLTGVKGQMTYTLADLAEYRPTLARGLQQLLDFEGDVESTYCWSFAVPVERYGSTTEVPLIPGGEKVPVTNSNRDEFVDAYVRYLLDTAVTRQFEPFKRGFFTVCAGNALNLFRAEEIELLIRGSDEALDVKSLKGVAIHENWRDEKHPHAVIDDPIDTVPVIRWFWEAFETAIPARQRKLLAFITSSDRIPAVGATSLVLRLVAGGDGWSGRDSEGRPEHHRYPIARTCFNMLVLWKYESKDALEQHLWRAIEDSEGFGLK